MDRALRGLGVHALPEELHVLQLLRHPDLSIWRSARRARLRLAGR